MIPQELNDAAVIVVQLEPTEFNDINELRDSLRHCAAIDENARPAIRAPAQRAATCFSQILPGNREVPALHRERAGEAIEAAVRAAEMDERGEPRAMLPEAPAPAGTSAHDGADASGLSDAMGTTSRRSTPSSAPSTR